MTAVTERCLQCVLLVACILVVSFDLATPVSCQGGCVPPLVTPGYMNPITITVGSWGPATSVTVKIDEQYFLWGLTVVNRIQDGEVKWNSPLTCSGVSFNDFEAVVFNQDDYACCCFPTPVLIDVSGNGFSLTDAYNGVMFDMGGDGKKEPVAWTTADNDDAWLVLDRNGNGQVDSAKEMFGNFTDQPHATTTRNGFVALAEW